MTSTGQLEFESKLRQTTDFIVGTILGLLCELYWDWKWLFIIAGIYAFIKAFVHYSKLKSLPAETFMNADEIEKFIAIEDPLVRADYGAGLINGYATGQLFVQLIRTFLVVGIISSLNKFLFGLTIHSTIPFILFVVFGTVTLYLTLKRVWTKKTSR